MGKLFNQDSFTSGCDGEGACSQISEKWKKKNVPVRRIIRLLDEEELGMFKERIRFLDKKIAPALRKFNWAATLSSAFIHESRGIASKVRGHCLLWPCHCSRCRLAV
jgi:hypothetical protein